MLRLLLPRADLRLVNVNLPARPRGIRWVRQAVEKYDGHVVPATDPYDRPVFWLAVSQLSEHAPETDLWAFERGYVTITPLRLDLTDHGALAAQPSDLRVTEFEEQTDPKVISDTDAEAADDDLPSDEWSDEPTTNSMR